MDATDQVVGSFTFTAGADGINAGSIDLLVDQIEVMLVTESPDPDADTVAEFSELRVAGYERKTLAGKSVRREGRRSVFRAANPKPWTLAPGGTVVGAVVFEQSTPLFFLEMRARAFPGGPLLGIPTNGSTFAIQFPEGVVAFSQQ